MHKEMQASCEPLHKRTLIEGLQTRKRRADNQPRRDRETERRAGEEIAESKPSDQVGGREDEVPMARDCREAESDFAGVASLDAGDNLKRGRTSLNSEEVSRLVCKAWLDRDQSIASFDEVARELPVSQVLAGIDLVAQILGAGKRQF